MRLPANVILFISSSFALSKVIQCLSLHFTARQDNLKTFDQAYN